jgi:hypothetical protein
MEGKIEFTEYVLYVQLAEIEPAIWRRVVVPGGVTLRQLHHIFQVTMGWSHAHIHEFTVSRGQERSIGYGPPFEGKENDITLDDRLISLAQIAPKKGTRFVYTYDLGDNWIHSVTVESKKTVTAESSSLYARCIGGQRAAPPEDVGGEEAYQQFLRAWGDQLHQNIEGCASG